MLMKIKTKIPSALQAPSYSHRLHLKEEIQDVPLHASAWYPTTLLLEKGPSCFQGPA
jgi:hypothetical protein